MLLQDPARQPTDDFEALVIDVMKDKLVHGQTVAAEVKTFDQLGRVGAAATDDRDLHAHTAAWYVRICANC